MDLQTALSGFAVMVAVSALGLSAYAEHQRRKSEALKELLGEKESVAFAALRLIRDGLPRGMSDRSTTLDAVMQACVFERSDRSRALLYRVLDDNRTTHGEQIDAAYRRIKATFDSMARFGFTREQLDLSNGLVRLETVERVLGLAKEPSTRPLTRT